jgi:hypothetical protein
MIKDSPIFVVILTLIAVCGTLGGVWLGRYLERDNDALKWRRDHALQAYTEVICACSIVMEEADNVYEMEEGAERVAQAKVLFEKTAEMYRLSDRVTLLAPAELHIPMNDLVLYYGQEIAARAQKLPKPSRDEWKAIRARAPALYMNFMMKARNDLGVHEPLYAAEEWKEMRGRGRSD